MITHWYVGFLGEYEGRKKPWFDIFTCKSFRHVLAIGYCPDTRVWVSFDTTVSSTQIELFYGDDPRLNYLIAMVKLYGKWLRVRPSNYPCPVGRWPLTCVSSVKHLLGIRSSALTPRALYLDLVRKGAQPAFEANNG